MEELQVVACWAQHWDLSICCCSVVIVLSIILCLVKCVTKFNEILCLANCFWHRFRVWHFNTFSWCDLHMCVHSFCLEMWLCWLGCTVYYSIIFLRMMVIAQYPILLTKRSLLISVLRRVTHLGLCWPWWCHPLFFVDNHWTLGFRHHLKVKVLQLSEDSLLLWRIALCPALEANLL